MTASTPDDVPSTPLLTRSSVLSALSLIRPFVHHTPVLTNSTLSALASTPQPAEALVGSPWEGQVSARPRVTLWFKCENLQRGGAFKCRGATHALLRLCEREGLEVVRSKGVVTRSSGNHAACLAIAALALQVPCTAVMPSISRPGKIAAVRSYSANIIFCGSTEPERRAATDKFIAATNAIYVPPFDDPDIVAGQGTVAVEFCEDVKKVIEQQVNEGKREGHKTGLDAIIAPCGGGGLLSGIALACSEPDEKGHPPPVVFGSEPSFQGADDALRSFRSGKRIRECSTLTIADGLRTPLGDLTYHLLCERRLVGDLYAVTEEQIKKAVKLVFERMRVVIEPSAAVPLAVMLFNEDFRALVEREAGVEAWDVGIVFSGGNLSVDDFVNLFGGGATKI